MRAIIIDDEEIARVTLKKYLNENCPNLEIVAVLDGVSAGVKAINKFQPDIVFSDIDMPGISGLQILDFFNEEEINFELIYVTSFSEYAVKAFQLSAIDYLLKPIEIDLLIKAVEKVEKKNNYKKKERHTLLKESVSKNEFNKIALPLSDGVVFVEIDNILILKADNVYTEVYLKDGQKIVVSKPIKNFEKMLSDKTNFYRAHRSYIINLHLIKQYIKSDGGTVIMDNEMHIPIARERKDDFTKAWENIKL